MTRSRRAGMAGVPLVGALLALAYLASAGFAQAGDAGPRLRVDYMASRVSVDAHDVTLAQVLREIGAKVGFTVVDNRASSALVSVSMQDASVDEVLRRLLRTENHTVLYVDGGGPTSGQGARIDTIVLLGAPGQMDVATAPSDHQPAQAQPASPSSARPEGVIAAAPGLSTPAAPSFQAPDATQFPSPDRMSIADRNADLANPRTTVGDILRTHAMAAALASQESAEGTATPAPPPSSGNLDTVLAETTRRAQQDLAALVDGLATATRSLQQSLAGSQR